MTDLLLRNARIWTGDAAAPWADAALVRNGRFAFVGRAQEIDAPAGNETLDAGGRLAVPGFIDGHAHLLSTGEAMRSVQLKGVTSVEEAVRRVGERAATMPAGSWVRGAGWDQHVWPGSRFPNRHQLDAVAPEHPVVLVHTSGHCVWVNSAALRAAGITAKTPVPTGGAIDVDDEGEPTGVLFDAAARLIEDVVPPSSRDERIAAIAEAIAHAHSLGVTGVHAMDAGQRELAALRALHERGELNMRVRPYLSAHRLDDWLAEGARSGDGDDLLRIGGVKLFADGALGPLTAWMIEPYEGTQDTGLALHEPAELEARMRRCLAGGLAPAVHAIGDRANREVLDVFERTRDLAPELPRRVEHAQLLAPEDMPRIGALGLIASVQPVHATQDMAKVDRWWGARGRGAYAFASLLAHGARLAFGSDSPVETIDPPRGAARCGHTAQRRGRARGRLVPRRAAAVGDSAGSVRVRLRRRDARGGGAGQDRGRLPRRLRGALARPLRTGGRGVDLGRARGDDRRGRSGGLPALRLRRCSTRAAPPAAPARRRGRRRRWCGARARAPPA